MIKAEAQDFCAAQIEGARSMSHLSAEPFGELCLEWARAAFAEELRTDFHRAQAFDSFVSKEVIRVLRRQPLQNIQILANVLPLKVSWETPEAIERRRRLPKEARKAVEMFRADHEREHHEDFYEKLETLWRADENHAKRSFQASVRTGNRLIMEIGDRWRCGVDCGAPGEWGLIFKKHWGRLTVSMNLSRSMDLRYTITLCDHSFHTALTQIKRHRRVLSKQGFWAHVSGSGRLKCF